MSRLRAGQFAVWVIATLLIWQSAWLSDDSLITIRTAINWGAGYGPVFNIDEAVQAYTHPLWFLIIAAVGKATGSWIYGVLCLNLACATVAIFLLTRRARNWWQLAVMTPLLVLGNTMLDWSTSGLEGGLSILLFALLFSERVRTRPGLVGVVLGLLLLCRLDFVLLVAAWAAVRMWRDFRGLAEVSRLLAGVAAPVAMWAIWAKATYGFVLPATFEAKTNSTIPRMELASRGIEYLLHSLSYDPILWVALLLLPLIWFAGDVESRAWVVGIIAYLGYVVVVGGDYLLGRFLLLPLFVGMLELTRTDVPRRLSQAGGLRLRLLWAIPCLLMAIGLLTTRSFDWQATSYRSDFRTPYLTDERIGWAQLGRSLDPFGVVRRRPALIPTDLAFLDTQARHWPKGEAIAGQPLVSCHGLGAVGMAEGPSTHIIDPCGLTDRFIASLAFTPTAVWKAGHFERPVPAGYPEAVAANDPWLVQDPELAARLEKLWETNRR